MVSLILGIRIISAISIYVMCRLIEVEGQK